MRSRYFRSRRAYRKRRGGALSTKRIFSKTSAKAQANQIYALRKSVTRLNRKLRPEVYTHNLPSVYSKTFSNGVLADSYWSGYYNWPAPGDGDNERRGDKIWCKNMQLNFTFEYFNNSSTGFHNSESSGCPVRVIILKSKTPIPLTVPGIDDILLYSAMSGDEYTQRAVSPYVHGITDKFILMYNKVFYMNPTKNQKALRIYLKPGLIQWEDANTATHVFMYVCPCGLHVDGNFVENIQMTMSGKIAYTDF